MIRGIGGDFRLAMRSLRGTPAVTSAAVITLTLGIGATTAIFSVANGVMLRPLPVANPERLVTLTSDTALRYGFQAGAGWNHAMWDQLRQRADAFDGAFAWTVQRLDLSEGGEMQPVSALIASGDFFTTLGVHAVVGRTFTEADDVRGGGPDGGVAVISEDLWRSRFNGAPGAIGSRLSLEGAPLTIIGVVPTTFRGVDVGQSFDLAMPFGAEVLVHGARALVDNPRALLLTVMLRLKPGQSVSQATATVRALQPQIVGTDAPPFLKERYIVVPASTGISDRSQLRQRYQRPLVILASVSALVLVIACVNIANLFLARASARRRELSIRIALGAPLWRLARPLVIEGAVLGAVSVVAGIFFAVWGSRTLVARIPAGSTPVLVDLPIDWRVMAFASALTMFAVIFFAIVPVLYAARVPPLEAMQEDARTSSAGRTGLLWSGLVVPQVAISIVLLAAAGLFLRTVAGLASVPLGFDPKGLLVVTVDARRAAADAAMRVTLYERISEAVAALPGVTHASGSIWTPVGTGGGGLLTDARGRRADLGRQVLGFNFVTPGWFATYGIAMIAGRDFQTADRAGGPRIAIVNQTFRRTLLRDRPAVGERIDAGPCSGAGCTVVGVVADTVYGGSLRDVPPPTVYVPLAQATELPPGAPLRLSVRGNVDAARLAPNLAEALRGIDARLAYTFRPLDLDVGAAVAQERLLAQLSGFFGAIALLLSGIGLYGVTWYTVARRRMEIGIRLALGGPPTAVRRMLLRRIALFVLAGTVVGLFIAVWLSRFVAPLLYGLESRDPATLAVTTLTLIVVASLAAWISASRAMRMDPAEVLRQG